MERDACFHNITLSVLATVVFCIFDHGNADHDWSALQSALLDTDTIIFQLLAP